MFQRSILKQQYINKYISYFSSQTKKSKKGIDGRKQNQKNIDLLNNTINESLEKLSKKYDLNLKTIPKKENQLIKANFFDQKEQSFENFIQNKQLNTIFKQQVLDIIEQPFQSKKQKLLSKLIKIDQKSQSFHSVYEPNENIYMRNKVEEINNENKRSFYQLQKYKEGELGIDYFHVNQKVKKEIESHLHSQQQQLDDQIEAYLGLNEQQTKMEKIQNWRDDLMMSNVDFTEDTMGIKEVFYPGSKKGPKPEDDPKSFAEWYIKNIPKPYEKILNELEKLKQHKIKHQNPPKIFQQFAIEKSEDNEQIRKSKFFFKKMDQLPANEIGDNITVLNQPLIQEYPQLNQMGALYKTLSNNQPLEVQSRLRDQEISPFPEFTKPSFHYSVDLIDKWSIFRIFPLYLNYLQQLEKLIKNLNENKIQVSNLPVQPTLYSYYYTLPQEVRKHPIVKTIVRALENTKHDLSLKNKQLALNLAAKYTMPMDNMIDEVLTEMYETEKYWVTAAQEEKFLQTDITQTQEEGSKKAIEATKEEPSLEIIKDWPRPRQRKASDIDEVIPDIPLHYYDNEDGFWNDYINKKEKEFDQIPLLGYRPFFKH